jgi:dsRNA-specific ribonuclease
MKFQVEVTGDTEAALAAIIADDGYADPEAWLKEYVAARLKARLLEGHSNDAAAEFNAALAAARATQDVTMAKAQDDVAAAVDAAVSVAVMDAAPADAKGG